MKVLRVALHVTFAIAVVSSLTDSIKDQIERGQWNKVSNENSTGVVDSVVNKTPPLADRMSDMSSPLDFIKDQIERGQWKKVSDKNSTGVVDSVVDKTLSLADRMSGMLNTQQLRHEPVKTEMISVASTAGFVVKVDYDMLGCKSFYEASAEASDVCIYSASDSYSTYLTMNDTSYTTKYYRDKFCEAGSYKSETIKFVNNCATNSYKGVFASSTPLISVDKQYVALR